MPTICLKRAGKLAVAALSATLLGVVGCASGGGTISAPSSTSGNGLASGGASVIYTINAPQGGYPYLLQFPVSNSGNLTPTATLTAPTNFFITAIATDSSGQLYVGGYLTTTTQAEVLVYAAGVSSLASPTRTISGGNYYNATNNTFVIPDSMTVSSNGTLYIVSYDQSTEYVTSLSPGANGTANPAVQIAGSSTQLYDPLAVAADAAGNIYVSQDTAAQAGSILVFAAGATGNVAPARVITSASVPYGLAVDTGGNLYTVLDSYTGTVAGSLVEFAPGASGAATPTRTISGASTGVFFGLGLRADIVGNLYLVNYNPNVTANGGIALLAFSPTANGNAAPPVVVSSSYWSAASTELAIR